MNLFKVSGLVFAMIFGFTSAAFSQNWFVGASAYFGLNKYSDFSIIEDNIIEREEDRKMIHISPEIGYKVNKFDFGINPVFQYDYSDLEQGTATLNNNFFRYGMGIFSRYNFVTLFDKLSILGRVDLSYLFSKQENDLTQNGNISQNNKLNHNLTLNLSPVFELKLSNRLSLYSSLIGNIASLRYEYQNWDIKNNGEHTGNGHSLTFNLPSFYNLSLTDISFGFYLTL